MDEKISVKTAHDHSGRQMKITVFALTSIKNTVISDLEIEHD